MLEKNKDQDSDTFHIAMRKAHKKKGSNYKQYEGQKGNLKRPASTGSASFMKLKYLEEYDTT